MTDLRRSKRRQVVQYAVEMESDAELDHDLATFCESSLDELYRYALRLTGGNQAHAADLVQETYVALVRRMNATGAEPVDVGWLIITCRHRFLDDVRSAGRAQRLLGRLRDAQHSSVDLRADVAVALGKLTVVQRTALVLRHVEGLPVSEVATAIHKSVHATESILRRGRSEFRRIYLNERAKVAE